MCRGTSECRCGEAEPPQLTRESQEPVGWREARRTRRYIVHVGAVDKGWGAEGTVATLERTHRGHREFGH